MSEFDPITSSVETREIPGLVGYRFGSDGRIWSCRILHAGPNTILGAEWHELKQGKGRKGYRTVSINIPGARSRTKQVHAMIATAFHGPCPRGMICRHLDDNPSNCRADNLAWGTHKDNSRDRGTNGIQISGERVHLAKLNADQVREIRTLRLNGVSLSAVAAKFSVSKHAIHCISNRKTWKDLD